MQRRRPQAGGTAAPAPSFSCDLSALELVEEFTYLGMAVHARQGFVYAAGPRAEKGRKAKSMRRRCAELGLQSVPVQLRMFDVFVSSVLSYGAEVRAPHLIAAGNACTGTRVHRLSAQFAGGAAVDPRVGGVGRDSAAAAPCALAYAACAFLEQRRCCCGGQPAAARAGRQLYAGGGDGRRGHCTPPLGWAAATCRWQLPWPVWAWG